MTYKEAISVLRADYYHVDTQDAVDFAIEVLEKADRYRRHDLRKDPNDLPSKNGKYEVVLLPKNLGYYWHSHEHAYYSELMGICNEKHWHNGLVGSDSYKNYDNEVIAWREIEPLEEEE